MGKKELRSHQTKTGGDGEQGWPEGKCRFLYNFSNELKGVAFFSRGDGDDEKALVVRKVAEMLGEGLAKGVFDEMVVAGHYSTCSWQISARVDLEDLF